MDTSGNSQFKDQMVGRLFLGRYRIVRRLAAGGMGVIYLARSEGAEGFVKPIVVKLIHPHFESVDQFSSMFIREAQIMSNLQHSGIINVIDFAKEDHTHVMVLEYVNGFQLRQWAKYRRFKGTPLPVQVITPIITNVLDALHYAHTLKRPDGQSMGIVHRDISSANILIDANGSAKLLDFGIAFVSQGTGEFGTRNTGFKGKLPYSAPELFSGGKASVLSDVYACAVILHELLIGKNEFASRDEQEIMSRILNRKPTSVLTVREDAPQELDDILQKAMAKKPEDRYQSADEFRRALKDFHTDDDQTATELISMMTKQDFGDEMAKYLGVESLADRDRAWRTPSLIPKAIYENAEQTPDGPSDQPVADDIDGKSEKGSPLASSRRVKTAIVITALLAIVVALGVALFMRSPDSTPEKPIFVVQSPVAQSNETPVDPPDDTASETVSSEDKQDPQPSNTQPPKETPPVKKPTASRDKGNKTADLGAAFRKRKNEIKNCFEKHAMNLDGQPKIFINFEIDENGKVLKSSLSPASISGTSLGGCLLAIAQSTQFNPPDKPIAFRIPVTTWRGQ